MHDDTTDEQRPEPPCPASGELQPLKFFPPSGSGTCRDFGGKQGLPQRARALRPQPNARMPQMHCGFLAPSAFDSAVAQVADHHRCDVVVLTAVFGGYDNLVQPRVVPAHLRRCFFAFVDSTTRALLLEEAAQPPPHDAPLGVGGGAGADALPLGDAQAAASSAAGGGGDGAGRRGQQQQQHKGAARVGAWRLVTVGEDNCKPYGRPRRNSRVPKLLAHRFFPSANYSLWINPDLALMMDPTELVERFLVTPRAVPARVLQEACVRPVWL